MMLIKTGIIVLVSLITTLLVFRPTKNKKRYKLGHSNGLRVDYLLIGFISIFIVLFLKYFSEILITDSKFLFGTIIILLLTSVLKMVKNVDE